MKKTMILAAFAALISLASCQKEDVIDNGSDKTASPVFTASIAGATKTTTDLTEGKVAWEETDEITVTDASSASAVYTIESIDATTGKATFVLKTGETALGNGPYTATYGTEPATAQTYSTTAGKLYMTAPATSDNSFTFSVQCGLMKLNLTKIGESVKSIAVTGTPTGGSETIYTLTCTEAESIASAKDFFIALPAGNYKKIEITNASDSKATLNSANGVDVAANHIKPVTLAGNKLDFIPEGALPGLFSIGPTDKVRFSKGNLRYTISSAKWSFFDEQYECGPKNYADGHNAEISLFAWGCFKDYSILPDNSIHYWGSHLPDSYDWGSQIGDGSIWRTLSMSDLQYLFSKNVFINDNFENPTREGKYKVGVTICGKENCLILVPDECLNGYTFDSDKTSYSAEDWETAEAAGLVCLPAAGFRVYDSIINVGAGGYYWSATGTNNSNYAECLTFSDSQVEVPDFYNPLEALSVRLVTDVY